MKSTQHGLSMIELISVVSIVGILLVIGVPSYRYVITSNRVSAEVNGLLMDMQFARSEAIKEGRTVTVCTSANGTSCANSNVWQNGWIVFMDINNNAAVDGANEVVLRIQPGFGNADTFVADNALQSVTFNREGFVAGLPVTPAGYVTVTLHDKTATSQWTRCVEITTIGRLRTERYGDSQGNCT
jgi:type IV fimbrial biogenesis protein FimT